MSNGTSTCNTSTGTCNTPVCNTGYYLDGSVCNRNDLNNCGAKDRICTIANGTSLCNINTGTCSVRGCDLNYHLSADGTSCVADTNSECGSLRENCNNMGSRYTGGRCSGGTCVPTGCATGYQLVNGNACVDFCYVVQKSDSYYCCKTPSEQRQCESFGPCPCEAFMMMVDPGGSGVFPYDSCSALSCESNPRLYCETSQCSSLNVSCNRNTLERYCFVSDRYLSI